MTHPLPAASDRNNYRGGFLWKCVLCGDWFSLWQSPTLWEHIETEHGISRTDLEHPIQYTRQYERKPDWNYRTILMEPFPYQWAHEQKESSDDVH